MFTRARNPNRQCRAGVVTASTAAAAAAMGDPAGPSAGDGGVVEISWLGLGLAAALILVQGAVSAW